VRMVFKYGKLDLCEGVSLDGGGSELCFRAKVRGTPPIAMYLWSQKMHHNTGFDKSLELVTTVVTQLRYRLTLCLFCDGSHIEGVVRWMDTPLQDSFFSPLFFHRLVYYLNGVFSFVNSYMHPFKCRD
jgi:hypothetical protein